MRLYRYKTISVDRFETELDAEKGDDSLLACVVQVLTGREPQIHHAHQRKEVVDRVESTDVEMNDRTIRPGRENVSVQRRATKSGEKTNAQRDNDLDSQIIRHIRHRPLST